MHALRIIGFCILGAITYGILHDQVTVRISPEYFTIGHPPIFNAESATLLALKWGVAATWWVGLILGVVLSVSARCGNLPPVHSAQLMRPIMQLLFLMFGAALCMGAFGYLLGLPHLNIMVVLSSQSLRIVLITSALTAFYANSPKWLP